MTPLKINGQSIEVAAEDDTPLLWVLRGELKMTGTKFGCGIAMCGACTVMIDGAQARSCVWPISALVGKEVTTIEGLAGPEADALRAAWTEIDVVQCGYCQSGQIMSAVALLKQTPKPSDTNIDESLGGNVCRCATYVRIREAVHLAAQKLR
jgi:isoquinoline 1-oxidoreductase alpha subunit